MERSQEGYLPLKDRVHCLWCIYISHPPAVSETFTRLLAEMPTAGGYVFGTSGDEEFFKIVQTTNCAFTIFITDLLFIINQFPS